MPISCPKKKQNIINKENISFINKVVWTHDGEITFYASGRRKGQTNSIYPNPLKPRSERERLVECIDFSKWVKDTFSKDDYIVLKMDIEGAEYEVLTKMLSDQTLDYINIMYLECHYVRANATKEEFLALRQRIKNESSVDAKTAIEWIKWPK